MYKSKYDENDFKINLFNAIYNEDIKKVKELVNNKMAVSNEFAAIPLNEHDDTPLHMASILGKENIVKMLLKVRANPNCMDDIGYTPLRIACSLGNKNIVNITPIMDKE
ncbi:Ankyrin repeats (3 copies) [Rickettsia monacensis]|uniref:Ankyrin repeats (3 copies) n=1 Tax=Rickettsia monacensis TaxID=109232 RepID=A0A0B7J3S5_9RICK|nr:Ankyrin repeats (3 copies) [Rickettsia monacensis IrR/Munich]CEO16964.1 Ankyrin repeats (3 copies) [Rickettsia monacensis]